MILGIGVSTSTCLWTLHLFVLLCSVASCLSLQTRSRCGSRSAWDQRSVWWKWELNVTAEREGSLLHGSCGNVVLWERASGHFLLYTFDTFYKEFFFFIKKKKKESCVIFLFMTSVVPQDTNKVERWEDPCLYFFFKEQDKLKNTDLIWMDS